MLRVYLTPNIPITMELKEVQELIAQGNFAELKRRIEQGKDVSKIKEYLKEYEVDGHDVMDASIRKKKEVKDGDNNTTHQEVNRLPVPLQKQIVRRAAAFLCGNPIQIESKPSEGPEKSLLDIIVKIWYDSKLDFESKTLAKHMFSETECAELWYWEPADEEYWTGTENMNVLAKDENGATIKTNAQARFRMKILAPSKGDTLYPVMNAAGDMILFARAYDVLDNEGKAKPHFDIYSNEFTYYMQKGELGVDWATEKVVNPINKIPIIYYSQPRPEWWDVRALIKRLETLMSNHADINDYNGSPIVLVYGKIIGFAKKGESGKVLELEPGAKAEYMEWDSAPESIKMEIENLVRSIFDYTDTPNISFDQLKGLGEYSGVALKMIFMAAHMKAADHEENFGKGIQRRLNLLKAASIVNNRSLISGSRLMMRPKFEYYLPKNIVETIDMLSTAITQKLISRKSAIRQNPIVVDADKEIIEVEKEIKEENDRLNANIIP
jgi:SPP1 family phage portal protein